MQNVSISAPKYINTFLEKNRNIHWYCDVCNKGMAQVIEEIGRLKTRKDLLEGNMKEMRKESEEMKNDKIAIEKK